MTTSPQYCAAISGGINTYTDGFLQDSIRIDEYIALCRRLRMVPAIAIKLQSGSWQEAQDAADWVQYVNGGVDTRLGTTATATAVTGTAADTATATAADCCCCHCRGLAGSKRKTPYNVSIWYFGNEIDYLPIEPCWPQNTSMKPPATGPE